MHRTLRASGLLALGVVLAGGCGEPEDLGRLSAALTSTFSATSPLCPATTKWGAWSQTAFSTWDSDVRPVVQWLVNLTQISSSTYSGHSPSIGRAADWRPHSREEGTKLANWFLANTKTGGAPLGIDYIIWQAEIYLPAAGGVKPMEDRGSFTQNHCDHIHISFVKSGSVTFDPTAVTPWSDPPPPPVAPDLGARLDSGPPSASGPDAGPPSAGEAGAPPPEPADPPPLPAAPEEQVPELPQPAGGGLVGGCALAPGASVASGALWLLVIVAGLLGASARRRGPRAQSATPHSNAEAYRRAGSP